MTRTEKAAPGAVVEEPRPSLPELCTEAADHVARARIALHDETLDTDQALIHLDEAITCLKRLWAQGSARPSAPGARLRSA